MKKDKKITHILIGMILGIVLGGTSAYAAIIYNSNQVSYSNSTSGLTSTNVQSAIDELANKTSNWINPTDMGTPTNYICDGTNLPTTSSPTTPPSGRTVYLALYGDEQIGVCVIWKGSEHCFRASNWIAEKKHAQSLFLSTDCNVYNYAIDCYNDDADLEVDIWSKGFLGIYFDDEFADIQINTTANPSYTVRCR